MSIGNILITIKRAILFSHRNIICREFFAKNLIGGKKITGHDFAMRAFNGTLSTTIKWGKNVGFVKKLRYVMALACILFPEYVCDEFIRSRAQYGLFCGCVDILVDNEMATPHTYRMLCNVYLRCDNDIAYRLKQRLQRLTDVLGATPEMVAIATRIRINNSHPIKRIRMQEEQKRIREMSVDHLDNIMSGMNINEDDSMQILGDIERIKL